MGSRRIRSSAGVIHLGTSSRIALLGCLGVVAYLTARLGGAMMMRPQMVWPLWPGCALLVAVLLLTPRKTWPASIAVGFTGFVLYDLQTGLTTRTIVLLILSDTIEVLTASLGVAYAFDGIPRLNSLNSFAKFLLFAVILAPVSAAFVGAIALGGSYWVSWRIAVLTEALALLTLTAAILGWADKVLTRQPASLASYLEAATLTAGLVVLGYMTFVAPGGANRPVLLYALVPFLLWAALRFGTLGISTSMMAIAFLSIWGAMHGRGPFTSQAPLDNVLALQLFLLFAATSFMVLASVVEERKLSELMLRRKGQELVEAQRLAQVGSWQWDITTGAFSWSEELYRIHGLDPGLPPPVYKDFPRLFTRESWDSVRATMATVLQTGSVREIDLEIVQPDGSKRWVTTRGEVKRDAGGRISHLLGTVHDITDRKQMSDRLRESEERFRLVANAAPVMIWMSGPDKLRNYFNQRWLEFTGRNLEAALGNGWVESVHPDDLEGYLDAYNRACDLHTTFKTQYRLRRHDGEYRWAFTIAVPRLETDGSLAGYIGCCIDVTERKLAEEALSSVNRRLIAAHEEERTRIARELHDDINQRIGMLAIEVGQFERDLSDSPTELRHHIQEVQSQVADLGSDIQALSHRLHSSKLEYLGLASAARSFCREFAQQRAVEIEFSSHDLPRYLPQETSLCLFRVLQEAVQNAVKHSSAKRFNVELYSAANEIHLTVSDSGVGFDVEATLSSGGLGIISMRERLRLLGGELFISSHLQRGTVVHARVPFGSRTNAAQTA